MPKNTKALGSELNDGLGGGKFVSDDRDPDEIIRALRDRIEELEPSLRDWKDMAMKYRLVLDLIIRRNKLMNPEICLDMLDKAAKQALD